MISLFQTKVLSFSRFQSSLHFAKKRSTMSGIFGGRDPFDDPFFTRPFGSLFGSSMSGSTGPSGDPTDPNRLKGLVIEELDSDDENLFGDREDNGCAGQKGDKYQENVLANQNPLVEHPEDQTDDHNNSKSKELAFRSDQSKVEGERPQKGGVSFQRVTYGGIHGAYYTASTSRRSGSDGVVLEESKTADRTTGQATHRISKGIHDKGHSVMRKLNSDGMVDTEQTLHNLDQDELARFEESWRGNADMHMPSWDDGLDFHSRAGAGGSLLTSWSGWGLPSREQFGRHAGLRRHPDAHGHSTIGRPKKVVTIPIE